MRVFILLFLWPIISQAETTNTLTEKDQALFSSIQNLNVEEVIRLINEGANINAMSSVSGITPVFEALCSGSRSLTLQLLELGADPSIQSEANAGKIYFRCFDDFYYDDEKEVLQLLSTFLKKGYNPGQSVSLWGNNPFHEIASGFFGMYISEIAAEEVIKMLIQKGADINLKNKTGNTPFHLLNVHPGSKLQKQELTKLFLNYGADPNIQNNDGESVLGFCNKYFCLDPGSQDIIKSYVNN